MINGKKNKTEINHMWKIQYVLNRNLGCLGYNQIFWDWDQGDQSLSVVCLFASLLGKD